MIDVHARVCVQNRTAYRFRALLSANGAKGPFQSLFAPIRANARGLRAVVDEDCSRRRAFVSACGVKKLGQLWGVVRKCYTILHPMENLMVYDSSLFDSYFLLQIR